MCMQTQHHRAKIREIAEALVSAGYSTVDVQAKALGVPRSTAWTILSGHHKASGLSVRIIQTMLTSHDLPPRVREKILEYVADKAAGRFGTNPVRHRRFRARMSECGVVLSFHQAEHAAPVGCCDDEADEQHSPLKERPGSATL
jgi:hypothetical protein